VKCDAYVGTIALLAVVEIAGDLLQLVSPHLPLIYCCTKHRRVNCLKWLPSNNAYAELRHYTDEKLLCGTEDGVLVCLDRKGVVYCTSGSDNSTSGGANSGGSGSGGGASVCSVECDGRLIYAGYSDGAIRCYVMHNTNTTSTNNPSPTNIPTTTTSTTNTTSNTTSFSTSGSMVEVYKHTMAHTGRITALSFSIAGTFSYLRLLCL